MCARWSLFPLAAVLASTFLGAGCISLTTPRPTKQEQARLDALVQQNLSPSPDRPIESVPQGRFTLPLQERVFGKFFVNCRLNGRSTDLMMDWGAGTTLGLTPRTTLDVKARLSDKWESSSWIDTRERNRLGVVDKMELGGNCLLHSVPFGMAQTNIDVVALGFIPLFRGQGMVGIPLLASFRKFAVDFRRSELVVGGLGDELLHARRCMTIPIIYRQSHLFMPVRIDGKTYELTVDIGGFNGTMTLDGEAAKEFANSHPHQQAGEATGSGQNAVRIYVSENCPFQAGDYGGKAPVVLMPDTPNSGPGTVGNAFFGKTVVGVDLDAGKLYFLPTETATDLPINQSTDQPVHLLAGLSGASIIAWSQLLARTSGATHWAMKSLAPMVKCEPS